MAKFFCCYLDNNGSLAVEEAGKCFAFGSRSDNRFDNTTFLVHSSLIRFVLVSRDVVAEIKMPRGLTASTWNRQVFV